MHEYKVLVRLNSIRIKKGYYDNYYGNCQICNEKHSQEFIEGSYNNNKAIFVFCKDCYSAVNDICSEFKLNGISYQYERVYNINNLSIKKKYCIYKFMMPTIIGNKVLF